MAKQNQSKQNTQKLSNNSHKMPKIVVINGVETILNSPDYYRNQQKQKNWLFKMPQAFYRNSIFLPVSQLERKVSYKEKKVIEIPNLCKFDLYYPVLNQTHANIIDAILYNAVRCVIVKDKLWAIVAVNEVIRTLGIGHNYSWLSKKIKEIQEAIFIAHDPIIQDGFPAKPMPIITHVDIFEGVAQSKYVGFKKTYAPYRVFIFSPLFLYLIKNSNMITFPKTLIPKILDLKYPINQAIARYCIASKNVNENLEKLLVKLGVNGTINGKIHKVYKHRYFTNIKEEQDKLFEYFQIEIKPLKNKELGVFRKVESGDIIRIVNSKQKLPKSKQKLPKSKDQEDKK